MKRTTRGKEDHSFGIYVGGLWGQLPDTDPAQRISRGQMAAALLRQTIHTVLQKSNRTSVDGQKTRNDGREVTVLYAQPPFETETEARQAGREINEAWVEMLKKPFAENVQHYLDTFRHA